ncbi:MAG: LamG domain-containing protein [Planctomycetes bacterium]|nr:LamG domain-containing protein [Planctomycetota bacterium]
MSLLDGLMAYWKLDESSRYADRADSHGGHTLWQEYGPYVINAVVNNGVSLGPGYLYADDHPDLQPLSSDFTLAFWFQDSGYSDGQVLIQKGDSTYEYRIELEYDSLSGRHYVWGKVSGASARGGYFISYNVWAHIALVIKNGVEITMYHNGSPEQTVTHTGPIAGGLGKLWVGYLYGQGGQGGNFDEIGIWKRALSTAEIQQLVSNGNGLSYPFGEVPAKASPFLMFLGI